MKGGGGGQSIKRFERSNRLDTALYKHMICRPFLSKILKTMRSNNNRSEGNDEEETNEGSVTKHDH